MLKLSSGRLSDTILRCLLANLFADAFRVFVLSIGLVNASSPDYLRHSHCYLSTAGATPISGCCYKPMRMSCLYLHSQEGFPLLPIS